MSRVEFATILIAIAFPAAALSAPVSVAGFSFASGEEAFADNVEFVSGWPLDMTHVNEVMVGSNVTDSFNTGNSTPSVIDVFFLDNSIVNGTGTDIVIFELSGDKPAGSPDPNEIFDVSVFDGTTFSSFVTVTPIATGYDNPADSTLDVFAVQIDMSDFGVPQGAAVDRIRIAVYNSNQGSKSADLAAVGVLNSGAPIPEPSTALLTGFGLGLLARLRRRGQRQARAAA